MADRKKEGKKLERRYCFREERERCGHGEKDEKERKGLHASILGYNSVPLVVHFTYNFFLLFLYWRNIWYIK